MNSKGLIVLTLLLTLLNSSVRSQQKYALLVGISNYHALNKNNEWNDIHGKNDIYLISKELKKQNFQISSLLETQATKSKIISELQKISKSAKKGSIIYIHFSMHGQLFDDALSTIKGDESWDESLVPIDALITYEANYKGEKHLVDDELNKYTESIRSKIGTSGIVYVVVDACHAGGTSKSANGFIRGTKRRFTNDTRKKVKPSDGHQTFFSVKTNPGQSPIVYLEACKEGEINTEMQFNGKYYGPMSYFIWETIRKRQIGRDTKWTESVRQLMLKKGPQNQNMVIEKSK